MNFDVIFIDEGNCDIFETRVKASGYRSALAAAFELLPDDEHEAVAEVRVIRAAE